MDCTGSILCDEKSDWNSNLTVFLLESQISPGFSNSQISKYGFENFFVNYFPYYLCRFSVLSTAGDSCSLTFLTFSGVRTWPCLSLAEFRHCLLSLAVVVQLRFWRFCTQDCHILTSCGTVLRFWDVFVTVIFVFADVIEWDFRMQVPTMLLLYFSFLFWVFWRTRAGPWAFATATHSRPIRVLTPVGRAQLASSFLRLSLSSFRETALGSQSVARFHLQTLRCFTAIIRAHWAI